MKAINTVIEQRKPRPVKGLLSDCKKINDMSLYRPTQINKKHHEIKRGNADVAKELIFTRHPFTTLHKQYIRGIYSNDSPKTRWL